MSHFEVADEDLDHCVATWSNALVSCWRAGAPPDQVRRMGEILAKHCQRNPRGILVVIRLVEKLPIPEAEGRDTISELMRTHDKQFLGWAIVIEGQGFRAAAARTAASTFRLLARASFPLHVGSSMGQVAPWIAERMRSGGATVTTADVVTTMEALRSRLGKQPPRQMGKRVDPETKI